MQLSPPLSLSSSLRLSISLSVTGGSHTLSTDVCALSLVREREKEGGIGRETERERERKKEGGIGRERDKERRRERCRIIYLFLKGMAGALAPFSYLVKVYF
jgi:hypothetical protein